MATRSMRWAGMLPSGAARQLWYVPMLAGAMGLMMARLFIFARILPVNEFAQFSGGILVSSTFCMLGSLGLQALLQREWPANLIRGQYRRGFVLAAQSNIVALACAIAGLVASSTGLSLATFSPLLLGLGIVHGLSQQLFRVVTVESRSRGDALRYAWDNVTRAVGALVIGVAVGIATGSASWSLAAEAVISLVLSNVIFRRSVLRAGLRVALIYRLAVRRLRYVDWASALTLMTAGTITFLAINVDRWVAASVLDANQFGAYSFAWTVLAIAQSIQAVISASAYPLLARRFVAGGRDKALRTCIQLSVAALVFGILCIIPLWFVLHWAVERWFDSYSVAIRVLPVFLIVALLRISDFWSSYLLVVGHEARLLAGNIAVVVVGVVTWFVLVRAWRSALQITDVALLAIILALLGYTAALALASSGRR